MKMVLFLVICLTGKEKGKKLFDKAQLNQMD